MRSLFRLNVRTHSALDRLFLDHQRGLLARDWARAEKRLAEYERELLAHMRHEERDLLPIYRRHGEAPGAPAVFFTGEHRRMREFLRRIKARLRGLRSNRSPEKVLALLDLEAAYKNLVQHHDRRERSKLYPALDRAATPQEREACLAARP